MGTAERASHRSPDTQMAAGGVPDTACLVLPVPTARRLVAAGHTVYTGSRDTERGRLAAERLGARTVQLDVTDDASAVGTPTHAYPGVAYPASKTAVNMITVQYAKAFPNLRINAVEPHGRLLRRGGALALVSP
ncbi:Rossmann-fold NAD(P)-binding domain-containing protein [Nonomuraea turcica]|uniref:hypothetical protein n=1 Tax=Nonomuraea sp. G32 TaxID=3067274 RepID=UPI00273AF0A8|nr:hypothetical protein [Nonomuraea sp. G32]MDP4509555.1 hypothetical protein [Nonomuraea sp. G32]